MHYLQPEFPPCGSSCPGCRLCCGVVFCKRISSTDSKSNPGNSSAKRLIQALEDVRKRTEFLQRKLSSLEKTSVGTQVDKLFPSPLKTSNSNLANSTLINSDSTIERDPKCTFDDKSISTEDDKSLSDSNDSKEIMNLCLSMMKEIREVRDSLKYSCKKICDHCHSRHLDSQQMCASTINCSKCKRVIRCYRNPQYCYSRGTSCYFKNRRNFSHPCDNEPRAYPRRCEPTPEEIQNTWCCWPFF